MYSYYSQDEPAAFDMPLARSDLLEGLTPDKRS